MRVATCNAVISALCLLLLACGESGEDDAAHTEAAKRAVITYLGVTLTPGKDEDLAKACDQLSSDAEADLVAHAELIDPVPASFELPLETCEQVLEGFALVGGLKHAASGVMDYDRVSTVPPPPEVSADDLHVVESDDATVELRVSENEKAVTVSRSGGTWKISQLDFSDSPWSPSPDT